MGYSVGQVAGFAGVTVRTLHHYDAIGLLSPGGRSTAGHRRYDDADLDRLQQILFYRELGFPLEEVAVLLDDPHADPREHLRRQHTLLTARIGELQRMAAAVEHAMEAKKMGINLTPEEKFEVFGDKDPERFAEESARRWGGTHSHAQAQARAAEYTKEDWQRMKDEVDAWGAAYAALMSEGRSPRSEEAMDLAEAHRRHLTAWFFECHPRTHVELAEMYVADENFHAFYEAIHPGLPEHLREAVRANAERRAA
ncbi:HTH-type transcriptional activator TipA [Streptomyces litmocidini]|uniref:MerR family transcriptional regulator n=1 Tax=Streptomyces litmocidini TaxID=67318 RepID=UPI00167DFADB|nr:MerR family transcriptional regulator [Streptomyces litmocidini]GGU79258.1 HTH-type transcriptional activator TipA [Streptomyces litmocidini]